MNNPLNKHMIVELVGLHPGIKKDCNKQMIQSFAQSTKFKNL